MDPIVSIFKKKDLLWQFFRRNVKQRHRGSMLGAFWLIANPLLMLCLYVFAFGVVFGGRFTDSPNESTLDYALGVFLGLSTIGLNIWYNWSFPWDHRESAQFCKKSGFST